MCNKCCHRFFSRRNSAAVVLAILEWHGLSCEVLSRVWFLINSIFWRKFSGAVPIRFEVRVIFLTCFKTINNCLKDLHTLISKIHNLETLSSNLSCWKHFLECAVSISKRYNKVSELCRGDMVVFEEITSGRKRQHFHTLKDLRSWNKCIAPNFNFYTF